MRCQAMNQHAGSPPRRSDHFIRWSGLLFSPGMEQCDLDTASRWRLEQRRAFFIGFSPLHGSMYPSTAFPATAPAWHSIMTKFLPWKDKWSCKWSLLRRHGRVFAVPTFRNLGTLASCNSDSRGDFKRLDFHSLSD